jgi:hypothetical protein
MSEIAKVIAVEPALWANSARIARAMRTPAPLPMCRNAARSMRDLSALE